MATSSPRQEGTKRPAHRNRRYSLANVEFGQWRYGGLHLLTQQLRKGRTAKLMFIPKRGHAESMWVRITERDGDRFVGTLDSLPICFKDRVLAWGDVVEFGAENVLDTG
jgi:hypothetical protein